MTLLDWIAALALVLVVAGTAIALIAMVFSDFSGKGG